MELLTRYLYNSKKYNSQYGLRQAIFENQRVAFGEFTPELMRKFSVVEEKYNPEDEMTDEELAARVRMRRDSLISRTDFYVQPDYPSDPAGLEAVKAYRQALRDIPEHPEQSGFPRNVQWPSLPSVLSRDKGLATVGLAKVGV